MNRRLACLLAPFVLILSGSIRAQPALRAPGPSPSLQGNSESRSASVSADGRFVAFQSETTNLVEGDGNDATDVFLHDRQTGQTTLISRGTNGASLSGGSFQPVLAASGEWVAL